MSTQVKRIIKNYQLMEQSLCNELSVENQSQHGSFTGAYREEVWANLFRNILPKKFAVQQNAFIIDSEGKTSPEVDIVIYDEQYVPYIFQYGETTKLIPIEAVFAVVQCKSTNVNGKYEENLKDESKAGKYYLSYWVEKVDELNSYSNDAYAYTHTFSENNERKTKPIKILCTTMKRRSDNSDAKFDIEITAQKGKKLKVTSKWSKTAIEEIVKEFNGVGFKKEMEEKVKEVHPLLSIAEINEPLIKLSFLLNQMIMLINNPMFFSHDAYAKMFKKHLKIE